MILLEILLSINWIKLTGNIRLSLVVKAFHAAVIWHYWQNFVKNARFWNVTNSINISSIIELKIAKFGTCFSYITGHYVQKSSKWNNYSICKCSQMMLNASNTRYCVNFVGLKCKMQMPLNFNAAYLCTDVVHFRHRFWKWLSFGNE